MSKVIIQGVLAAAPVYIRLNFIFRNPSDEFNVESVYNRSSIYLYASWNEGFGLAPAEVMACGAAGPQKDAE